MNFIPKMDKDELINGYGKVLSTIYSPKCYYARIRTFLSEYKPKKMKTPKVRISHVKGFFASMWITGTYAGRQILLLEPDPLESF